MPKKTKLQVIKLIRFLKDWPTGAQKLLRRPRIEPGSTAWKAAMLTTIPPTPIFTIR